MVLARLASSGGQMGIPTDDAIMDEGRDSSMEIDSENPNSSSAMKDVSFSPRGYQLEMLEASMNQNIIVAMDTGSGKTHIAVMRIIAELEKCPSHKMVWFLAPTVALCFQQYEVLTNHAPKFKTRVLTGLDNVDRWTEQSVWDKVLQDVRIVVSTHAVLSDALNHGFVRMSQLALLVFDEAHHCMRRHPANQIMQSHYHPMREKFGHSAVPHILGLTASPIVRSKQAELKLIETNLNAVCRTPRANRTELLECVHRPKLERIDYLPLFHNGNGMRSRCLPLLERCIEQCDIQDDPYIDFLRLNLDTFADTQEAVISVKTFCKSQLVKFLDNSIHIYEELGGWAADLFIETSIKDLNRSLAYDKELNGIDRIERQYLKDLLLHIPFPECRGEPYHLSPKLEALLGYLRQMDQSDFSAIVFAKRRILVGALAKILDTEAYHGWESRVASFVGWSSQSDRSEFLGNWLSRDQQRDTLGEFKAGRKNLIIATDALEEGLDISSCSLVICFDQPANLKSFVQRRGRARRQKSTYMIMVSQEDEKMSLGKWQKLEEFMIQTYQDDERRRTEANDIESQTEPVSRRLFVPSTGACLSAEESVQHVHHFCSLLPHSNDFENRPVFTFEEDSFGLVRSTLLLPPSVHPAVRRTPGQSWWKTERAAVKESSFLAYEALWNYGLVNDNLLPVRHATELEMSKEMSATTQAGSAWISGQFDPYERLARAWSSAGRFYQTVITFSINGVVDPDLTTSMVLPMLVTMPAPITLYWSLERQIEVQFSPPTVLDGHLSTMQQITKLLLAAPSSYGGNPRKEDYVVPFVPCIPPAQFEDWIRDKDGTDLVMEMYERDPHIKLVGFIRDTSIYAEARVFIRWIVDSSKNAVHIECQSLPPRRNLLNPATMYLEAKMGGAPAQPPKIQAIPATGCTMSRLSASTGILGRFFSAILDRFEATLVAQELADTILKVVKFEEIGHVLTAITMPIAQAATDYQLYEFFGDSVLKFTVACQLFYKNPTWQESRLSSERDKFISNANLTQAALKVGLDAFILNTRFTPTNWSAPSISERLSRETPKRQLGNKVIADVVEALIGAAYMDGGMLKAQKCLYRFLPDIDILQGGLPFIVRDETASTVNLPESMLALLGYNFNDISLMKEALTHASASHDGSQSYNRLEYLGDAVLDIIIISTLASIPKKIPQGQMTLLKHACTNGNLLGFLCMNLYIDEQSPDSNANSNRTYLHDFLRYNGNIVSKSRQSSLNRHAIYLNETIAALQSDTQYPWLLLAQMHADKFFCDILESTIGAIFLDSQGDLNVCTAFVERVGVLRLLRRFIQDEVDVQHPRNKAQGFVKENRRVEFKISGNLNNYTCTARYGPKQGPLEDILAVHGVTYREEAEIRAAYAAIPLLKDKEAENAMQDEQVKVERAAQKAETMRLKKKRKHEAKLHEQGNTDA
ncbi:hypothetical protein N7450_001828 [Penicillium hetheringtonii]|uniref:Dicer-like protein 2 n=1 Tax=Penicillium hetheringtonii TaxID=911720 RepID=A0AAD6E5C5_9EURO|nr:hypothetical protein N7450_001828 [Penicillium hetheringtonii]